MDRSYRLKMDANLEKNILTPEYIINCIAKDDKKINELAYKQRKYEYVPTKYIDFKSEKKKLVEYRQPFIDILMRECNMSLDDIKNAVKNTKVKNIPTKEVCNRIRDMIVSGYYRLE